MGLEPNSQKIRGPYRENRVKTLLLLLQVYSFSCPSVSAWEARSTTEPPPFFLLPSCLPGRRTGGAGSSISLAGRRSGSTRGSGGGIWAHRSSLTWGSTAASATATRSTSSPSPATAATTYVPCNLLSRCFSPLFGWVDALVGYYELDCWYKQICALNCCYLD